jgi:hypothetical protein
MSNVLEVSLTCSKSSTNNNGVFNDFYYFCYFFELNLFS